MTEKVKQYLPFHTKSLLLGDLVFVKLYPPSPIHHTSHWWYLILPDPDGLWLALNLANKAYTKILPSSVYPWWDVRKPTQHLDTNMYVTNVSVFRQGKRIFPPEQND